MNENNFWELTEGLWNAYDGWTIEMLENFDFIKFAESKDGSKYYIHGREKRNGKITSIIRASDHWGGGIGTCNWYLNEFEVCNSFSFKEKYNGEIFIAEINLSELRFIEFKDWKYRGTNVHNYYSTSKSIINDEFIKEDENN